MRIAEIRQRASIVALLSVGALVLSTVLLILASFATPAVPPLGDETRYYTLLLGAFIGWIWMGAGLILEEFLTADNDPVLAGGIFAAGLGMIAVYNGIVVHNPYPATTLRVAGYIVHGAVPLLLALYYGLVPEDIRRQLRDPDSETESEVVVK